MTFFQGLSRWCPLHTRGLRKVRSSQVLPSQESNDITNVFWIRFRRIPTSCLHDHHAKEGFFSLSCSSLRRTTHHDLTCQVLRQPLNFSLGSEQQTLKSGNIDCSCMCFTRKAPHKHVEGTIHQKLPPSSTSKQATPVQNAQRHEECRLLPKWETRDKLQDWLQDWLLDLLCGPWHTPVVLDVGDLQHHFVIFVPTVTMIFVCCFQFMFFLGVQIVQIMNLQKTLVQHHVSVLLRKKKTFVCAQQLLHLLQCILRHQMSSKLGDVPCSPVSSACQHEFIEVQSHAQSIFQRSRLCQESTRWETREAPPLTRHSVTSSLSLRPLPSRVVHLVYKRRPSHGMQRASLVRSISSKMCVRRWNTTASLLPAAAVFLGVPCSDAQFARVLPACVCVIARGTEQSAWARTCSKTWSLLWRLDV